MPLDGGVCPSDKWASQTATGQGELLGCNSSAPDGVLLQQSGAKLFPELQHQLCYTSASSPFVQLILCLCTLVNSPFQKQKFNIKFLQSKFLFWEAFDHQRSDSLDTVFWRQRDFLYSF